MNLIPWKNKGGNLSRRDHPWNLFRREMDSLFGRFFGQDWSEDFDQERFWDFGITENDNEFLVRAEMPGFEEKDLDVRLEDNVLTIKAEKEHKEGEREERRSFFRTMTL